MTTVLTCDKQTALTHSDAAAELVISNFRYVSHWSRDAEDDGDATVMWRERLTVAVSNSAWALSSTERCANTDDAADKTALAAVQRDAAVRLQLALRRVAADSAPSVETLGVVIDNWIQSSTNAAAAAVAAASVSLKRRRSVFDDQNLGQDAPKVKAVHQFSEWNLENYNF